MSELTFSDDSDSPSEDRQVSLMQPRPRSSSISKREKSQMQPDEIFQTLLREVLDAAVEAQTEKQLHRK